LERKEESPILQVAVSLKGLAKVGKVNCERYRQLCAQAGISGYPTIR
jgi:thioredoxin-like negative regulator of GroEL